MKPLPATATKKTPRILAILVAECVFILLLMGSQVFVRAGTAELGELMAEMEGMVLEFRGIVEQSYAQRCEMELADCEGRSYHGAKSALPDPDCKEGGSFEIRRCSVGAKAYFPDQKCGSKWDFTTSTVTISKYQGDEYPTDSGVKEVVCSSQDIGDYLVEKYQQSLTKSEVEFVGMFYGAWNSVFRIFPGRPQKKSGAFDPRRRPWYTAAITGPKNMIIVVEHSNRMSSNKRGRIARAAAKSIVETLTISDYVGFVEFGSEMLGLSADGQDYDDYRPSDFWWYSLREVSEELKDYLYTDIGGTGKNLPNYEAGFEGAFKILDHTLLNNPKKMSSCNTAIEFISAAAEKFTDAEKNSLLDLIAERNTLHGAKIFTFSVGNNDAEVYPTVLQDIACSTGAIYKHLDGTAEDIRSEMDGFYNYYATALALGGNENFTTWVEPYEFATGGSLGTTVSAPVYDRTTSPFRFLGAVGIDFSLNHMEEVAGGKRAYQVVLEELVKSSSSYCSAMGDLNGCELQALRSLTSHGEFTSICSSPYSQCNSSTFEELTPETCMAGDAYPDGLDLWENLDMEGKGYNQKVCCETENSRDHFAFEMCEAQYTSAGLAVQLFWWVAFFLGLVCVSTCLPSICCLCCKGKEYFDCKEKKGDGDFCAVVFGAFLMSLFLFGIILAAYYSQ